MGDNAYFRSVFDHIDGVMSGKARVVMAVDGMCASGKSTLAEHIAGHYACNVFHMDDFFLTPEMRTPERLAAPGGNIDVERFEAEVLKPLLAGSAFRYRRYDCRGDAFVWRPPVAPKPLEILEGAYSLHPRLRGAVDLAVGLRVAPDVQLRRIAAREGEDRLADFQARWIPLEEHYLAETQVWARCDLILDTTHLF